MQQDVYEEKVHDEEPFYTYDLINARRGKWGMPNALEKSRAHKLSVDTNVHRKRTVSVQSESLSLN
jgi:hypothetical protein